MTRGKDNNTSDIILEVLDRMEVRLKKMDDQWNDRYAELETEVTGHTKWINTMTGRITAFMAVGAVVINLVVDWIKSRINL